MGKITYQDNFRVVMEPELPHDNRQWTRMVNGHPEVDEIERSRYCRSAAELLATQARRHMDAANIHIEVDTIPVCEWCGATWTEGDSPHNGGCCDKDMMDAVDDAEHVPIDSEDL